MIADPMKDIAEIHRLLREAYDHYFANSDGYCKSSEGYVELRWPNYFEMRDGETEPSCGVYSYVLGPSRMHDFDNTAEALAAVRKWHREEMAHDYRESEATPCLSVLRDDFSHSETLCDLDADHPGWHENAEGTATWSDE